MKQEQTAPAASSSTFKSVKEVEAHARTRMDKVLADLQHEMASIRTGRASVGILDSVRVDYYGTPAAEPGGQLHVPEPAMITIQPWDVSRSARSKKPFAVRIWDLILRMTAR